MYVRRLHSGAAAINFPFLFVLLVSRTATISDCAQNEEQKKKKMKILKDEMEFSIDILAPFCD